MTSNRRLTTDRRVVLSAIWIFVLFNMIYADIVGMLVPGYPEHIAAYRELLT